MNTLSFWRKGLKKEPLIRHKLILQETDEGLPMSVGVISYSVHLPSEELQRANLSPVSSVQIIPCQVPQGLSSHLQASQFGAACH